MPQKKHSPIAKLALPQFRNRFSDLLGVQAFMTPFTHSLIEGIFERILRFGRTKHDYDNFERSARAAYHFLDKGSQIKPRDVAQQFAMVTEEIIPALNKSELAQEEAKQVPENDADARIKKYLEYYKVMYEGLLPFICAPVLYAFGIAKHTKDEAFKPRQDGKVDSKAINKMGKWLVYSENRLAIGLNSHIRNAYSHEYYRILDDAQVELWDINPGTQKLSWGPEIWHLDRLITLCDQLWVNALGATCALVLYDINNRRMVEDRGWISPTQLPTLRREELNTAIEAIADELGFYLKKIETLPNGVSITLSTKSKGIDQEGELYMGYKSHTRLFKIPMWYEEKRVIDQLTIMLHRLIPYFETQSEVSTHVRSPDDAPLGVLITDFLTLIGLQLTNTKPKTVESIRHVFKIDTLGDCVTFVEKEGAPRFVGTRPVTPNNS